MVRIPPAEIQPFVEDACLAMGCSGETASAVAESLVLSDRQGHDSHGVFRVAYYMERVERGVIDPTATPTVERGENGTTVVDGHAAFGQHVGRVATEELVRQATDGVGVVGITNSAHLGRIGEWAQRVAREGLLFVALVKGTNQTVAPPKSAERCFSTNPLAFGVPTFDALPFQIVVDIATSQVANGKIRTKAKDGEPIPEGWAIDDDGEPLLDAEAFIEGAGASLPLGGAVTGHKGFGLGVAAELFASIVGDTPVIGQGDYNGNAAAFLAVDPRVFLPVEMIESRVASLAALVRNADYIESENVGLLPGEPEYLAEVDTEERGIPVAPGIADGLRTVAERYDLESSLPAEVRDDRADGGS
jgi:uncharacterized oxidoreductase